MSSWKNAVKLNQNIHKERHQPHFRNKLGLLEKKPDYISRAKNFNEKQATIKLLRKHILNKNTDEFNFHMCYPKMTTDSHNVLTKTEKYSDDQIKLMETQDIKYINYKRILELKKIENLQNSLHMIDAANDIQNNHTFYIDNKSSKNINITDKFKTHNNLLNRRTNRPNLENLQTMRISNLNDALLKKTMQQKQLYYRELCKRLDREHELHIIQQTLEINKTVNDQKVTKPKQIRSGFKNCSPIYKWKFERKK